MAQLMSDELTNNIRNKWSALAVSQPEVTPGVPVHVILGEAIDLAMLFGAFWEPTEKRGKPTIPGFNSVEKKGNLHEDLGNEIHELHTAVAKVQAEIRRVTNEGGASPMERSEFVLLELKSTLTFAFDDDEHTIEDDQLEKLNAAFTSTSSQDAMAGALEAYADFAQANVDKLDGIGDFSVELLDEARTLAVALREQSGLALVGDVTSQVRDLVAERNRLVGMLQDRVGRVRRAARYVYRAHPEVARKFSSTYERTQRRSRRAKAAAETNTGKSGEQTAAQ